MDINAALAELRSAQSDWEDTRGRGEDLETAVNAADRMRDAIHVVDEWLSMGGHLPSDWQTRTRA